MDLKTLSRALVSLSGPYRDAHNEYTVYLYLHTVQICCLFFNTAVIHADISSLFSIIIPSTVWASFSLPFSTYSNTSPKGVKLCNIFLFRWGRQSARDVSGHISVSSACVSVYSLLTYMLFSPVLPTFLASSLLTRPNTLPCFPLTLSPSPTSSPDVRQYLWERVGHHPAAVLGDGPLPHPDAKSEGVHPLPPDPQSTQAEAGGVFPACLVLHQRHWHECCEYRSSCSQILVCTCVYTWSVNVNERVLRMNTHMYTQKARGVFWACVVR